MAEVFLLLFADDVALVSLTPGGLQNQLNNLKAKADRLKLEVNLAKTSIIVFRKGRHLSLHERWTYGDVEVEVVNSYKYLGIALTTKLSTTQAVADFIPKAKRKIITILKALRKINCTNWECLIRSLMPKYSQRFCTPWDTGYRESGDSWKDSLICHQEVLEVKQQNS